MENLIFRSGRFIKITSAFTDHIFQHQVSHQGLSMSPGALVLVVRGGVWKTACEIDLVPWY